MTKFITKLDLNDAISKGSFDHALLSTFTFEPSFFEQHCLERFKSLNANGNITVLVDRNIYEELLVGDPSERPKKANIRYLLQPVSATGLFHSKIYLFARSNKGKLIIGSANLTRNGITSNAEMVAAFDYDENDQTFRPIFRAAFNYFAELAQRFPTQALHSNLNALATGAPWLLPDDDSSEAVPQFLHNLDEPIWDQVCRELVAPIDSVYVLSRYFDARPSLLDEIDKRLSPKKIKIFTQNRITNMTPEWLQHTLVRNGRAEIFVCRFSDADHAQPLHAKAIAFETNKRYTLIFGSANFSSAALLRSIRGGNAETVLMIKDLSVKAINPIRLFDPEQTAELIKEPHKLHRTEDEVEYSAETHLIRLNEAWIGNDRIVIDVQIPDIFEHLALNAILRFQNSISRPLKIRKTETGSYIADVSEVEKHRLDNESTIIQVLAVEDRETIASSNSLLITNLKDPKTDRSIRRQRHLIEAMQSAAQFFAVLRELSESDDEEALRIFLTYCDIPLIGAPRPFFTRRAKPQWDGGAGMKALGSKNFKLFKNLHGAAMDFFDRHFRKLKRHTDDRTLVGVANFLHIFLAMGDVLRSQMERSVIGLEANGTASSEEWGTCRKYWDAYFNRYKQLMNCLATEYLAPMIRKYGLDKIKEELGQDLEPMHNLCDDMLNYRARIEAFRTSKLKIIIPNKPPRLPSYFYSYLSPEQWPGYSREVRGVLEQVERTFGYAA